MILAAVAVILCTGTGDTERVQAAVNISPSVAIGGECLLDASVGIKLPTGSVIDATAARFRIMPGCQPRCRAFETVVGAKNIRFFGGTVEGDYSNASGVQWRIGFRVDSAENVEIIGTTFSDWRTDGIWIGGNRPGSKNVRVTGVTIQGSGRNHISASSGSKIYIERCVLRNTRVVPGQSKSDPGAGIDIEPNLGEVITDLIIAENEVYGNEKGLFVQPGQGDHCTNCHVRDNVVVGNRQWGIAVNSVVGGSVTGNRVFGSPIGMTIGGATEATRASQLIIADNVIEECPVGLRLPGIKDSDVVRNRHPGPIAKPALGDAGDMSYRGNVQE